MWNYKLGIFLFFILGLLTIVVVKASTNAPLLGKVIYIDPGHGGIDGGATYKGIEEAGLNLKISQKLAAELDKLGATTYLTRYGDYDLSLPHAENRKRSDLSRRGNLINRSGCDLYLSIHLNAEVSSSWHGAEVYYDDVNAENKVLAKIMEEELQKNLNSRRKFKETKTMYLHHRVTRPGVLLEVGFLSNPNERYLLQQDSYQQKVAKTVTYGVIRYFSK